MNIVDELLESGFLIRNEDNSFRISNGKSAYWLKREESRGFIYRVSELTYFLPEISSLHERLYCLVNNITSLKDNRIKCIVCGNKRIFKSFSKGYSRYCSKKCLYNDKDLQTKKTIKSEKTKMERYGDFRKAWNKGLTKETSESVRINGERSSITKKIKYKDGSLIHPMKGRIHTKEARRKMSVTRKKYLDNLFSTEEGYELYCNTKKKEMKLFVESHPEWIEKIRLKSIENRILKLGYYPNYNRSACNFFEILNRTLKIEGKYAESGGEFYISEIGFFLDFFDENNKIIIEWDEAHHFYKNGELKKKDILRQEKIEKMFPDFMFIRIKDFNLEDKDIFNDNIKYIEHVLETNKKGEIV